jgi:hypothetical protein
MTNRLYKNTIEMKGIVFILGYSYFDLFVFFFPSLFFPFSLF